MYFKTKTVTSCLSDIGESIIELDLALIDDDDTTHQIRELTENMRRDEDSFFFSKRPDEIFDFISLTGIESLSRLIENENIGIADK